ncbi:hypothetical protein BH18THE2_BH18THE2_35540 [soil metagenome]
MRDNISSNNKLGIPLPSGVVRVNKEDITSTSSGIDSHQQMIFIGKDSINLIPRNENITLQIGNAFNIVGQTLVSETNPSEDITISNYNIALSNREMKHLQLF